MIESSPTNATVKTRALLLALTALVTLAVAAAGPLLLRPLGGDEAAAAMRVAAWVAFGGALLGWIPVLVTLGGPPMRFVAGYLGGLGLRFAGTMGLAFAALLLVPSLERAALLYSVAVVQLVLLACDTAALLWVVRAGSRP